jgi:hypothetical protein
MVIREKRKHRRTLTAHDIAWLTSDPLPAQEARRMRLEVAFASRENRSVTWEEFLRRVATEPDCQKAVQPRLRSVK